MSLLIGLFGGTFDPPHRGHLAAVETACDRLGLDRITVLVANDPWQKSQRRPVTAAHHRLAMTRLAFAAVPGVQVSDAEIARGGPTYTVDTVRQSAAEGADVFWIVGAGTATGIASWHRADELTGLVTLAVLTAPDAPVPCIPGFDVMPIPMEPVEASSTAVRALAAVGDVDRLTALLAPEVLDYITARGLYLSSVPSVPEPSELPVCGSPRSRASCP